MVWKEHFAPTKDSTNIIQVPSEWVNFLSVTLLTPDKFDLAKKFITSMVWGIISSNSKTNSTVPFVIPDKCPTDSSLACMLYSHSQGTQEQANSSPAEKSTSEAMSASSTSALHKSKKRKDNIPLVETEVRRTCRLQKLSKGFRKAVCRDRDFPAFHSAPPVLPAKIIKSLNTTFCKVSDKDTTEEILSKKARKNKGGSTAAEGTKGANEKSKKWI